MEEIKDTTPHRGRPKKVVQTASPVNDIPESDVVENDAPVEPMEAEEVAPKQEEAKFVPRTYAGRGKNFFIQVFDSKGVERMFQFMNNGACGVFVAKTQEEVDTLQSSEHFGKHFFLVTDEKTIPKGVGVKAVIGARSALNGQIPSSVPRDAAVEKMIAEAQRDTANLRTI